MVNIWVKRALSRRGHTGDVRGLLRATEQEIREVEEL